MIYDRSKNPVDTSGWVSVDQGYLLIDPGDTELDYGKKCALLQACIEEVLTKQGPVVLDLSLTPFLDSSALGLILQLYKELEQQARILVLVTPHGGVASNVLCLTRLRAIFTCTQTRDEAFELL